MGRGRGHRKRGSANGAAAEAAGRSCGSGAGVEQREAAQSCREADRERPQAAALCWRGRLSEQIHTHVWAAWPHDSSYVDNSSFRKAYHRGSPFKMPILLFLLDTSASMNQRTYLGTTYLDVAKGAVEVFMKVKNDFTPTLSANVQLRWASGSLGKVVRN